MFERRYNLGLYAVATVLLYAGVALETEVTMWLTVGLFVVWDLLYVKDERSFEGRDVRNLLEQVNVARLHMSYFLPFYGVLLGILFTLDAPQQQLFFNLLASADISMGLLMLPLVVASLGILFIPIRLVRTDSDAARLEKTASNALKALLGAAAFFQQASIFIFLHVILRILGGVDGPTVILVG